MATQSRSIRRGLPRVEGGDPWPPAGEAPARIVTAGTASVGACFRRGTGHRRAAPPRLRCPPLPAAAPETAPGTTAVSAPVPAVNSGAAAPRQLRRGLPRVPGGEPWPPAGEAPASVAALSGAPAAGATQTPTAAETPTPAAVAAAAAQEVPAASLARRCSGHRTRHPDNGNHTAPPRASPRPGR